MTDRIMGECSCCGGDVVVPLAWLGVHPPTPACRSCGATAKVFRTVIETTPRNAPRPVKAHVYPSERWGIGDYLTSPFTLIGSVLEALD